ncbi:unnamed protein product [Rotaria sordida]|uniref:Uncharacterized protein n=2 Tax=Rotaria sordida TaxID=392033 RepID=A0A819UWM4_9BILA|nr:unnamed protein product [Rotaria sordida]
MHNFDDCLCLLDGRLSQLHTFIITLDYIYDTMNIMDRRSLNISHDSLMIINNLNTLLKLNCFSLYVRFSTYEFDSLVVPLLRRMSNLEKLTLSLHVSKRNSFIDGTYLHNYVLNQMSHLHTFIFDIVTDFVRINQEFKPSSDDIRCTFIERGHDVDCYIDYYHYNIGRCHVYSLPFNMKHIRYITHSFPGGMFMNVRILLMCDIDNNSFEHDFFARISRSFPLLSNLTIANTTPQNKNRSQQLFKPEETSSIIEYSHLDELIFSPVSTHIDYVEEFLCNLNTRLPCLSKFHVKYEHLVTVTENFTRNTTRMNCAKLKYVNFYRELGICYICEGGFTLNYTVTSDTVPSFSKCQLVNGGICWITVIWNQNNHTSSFLVDSINTLSVNYTSEHIIMASADMTVVHQHEFLQVNHSFGYVCLSNKCNNEMSLKQILHSLVIEDKFAHELTPLLEIISPFDTHSAACYDFNNYTVGCASTDLDTCQRCQISVDREPPPSQQICATCPYYSEDPNSISRQIVFLLDSRTQSQNIAKINCQLKACNSIDNINRVYKTSKITFDFGEFFKNFWNNNL